MAVAQHVAPTDAQPPEEQREKFELPPGFEIQLIVSEPDIGQPMNLNFDARGRLWITSSLEYPYPAKSEGLQPRGRFKGVGDHPPRDRLTVVEGIGPDGKPSKVTHFAEGLNIPIGHTPLGDGSSALVYGIPAIFRVSDDDGDGRADRRDEIYGRFGNVDTHGMANSFTRWIDGWIYGCHGFSNTSEVTDADGRAVKMKSGNTYRFRADGSHFQQFTWGQVNPFGLTFDPLGNLYSADCHSKPVYLLLRGARYPHFGDKPDGLGFGPTMINHNHGSTGICGPAYYAADHFPADYHDNIFICNPVTGHIHRDKLKRFGSTYQCDTQPDFLTCGDPWFRPVDCIVGPDGALYLADFYNAVIGHYEVPLEHPKRDRAHGRVWRIIYRGEDGRAAPPEAMSDLTKLSAEELVERLADPNLLVRTLATNFLIDAHAKAAPAIVRSILHDARSAATARAHGLWILERLGQLDEASVRRLAADPDRLVRVHVMKMLAERAAWSPATFQVARRGLDDEDGFVRRAAADALGRHPDVENVSGLIEAWNESRAADTHLIHTIRLALRSHVRDTRVVADLLHRTFDDEIRARLVKIAATADSSVATPLLLYHAQPGNVSSDLIRQAAAQIARYGSREQIDRLIEIAPRWFDDDASGQLRVFIAICDGLQQKGIQPRDRAGLRNWLVELAPARLRSIVAGQMPWNNRPVPGLPPSNSPWGVRHRGSTDGHRTALFWDSISQGEQLTGILRSRPFKLPPKLSFWMCGHNGRPGTSDPPVNHVRLVLEESGEVIAKEVPPRHDTARKYTWALEDHAGKRVVVEIVDAHRDSAYAWIGVGRFEPPVLRVPAAQADGAENGRLLELVGQFELEELGPQVLALAAQSQRPVALRSSALAALERLGQRQQLEELLIKMVNDGGEPSPLRAAVARTLAAQETEAARLALIDALAGAPAALQREIALAMTQNAAMTTALLDAIAAGKASARLLQQSNIAEQLQARAAGEVNNRIADLTKNLPEPNQQIAKLIEQRRDQFIAANSSADRGREMFTKHCGACHRIGETGGMVGPQLDGIGNRGLERLLEDILDPNRNVDIAFRTTLIETTGGKVLSGLERRREGEILVLADSEGKELRIAVSEIAASRRTRLSLMPTNIAETLKADELGDLLAYLLAQQQDEQP